MKIKRHYVNSKKRHREFLTVNADIHFDNECVFCGQPWINLIAFKDAYDSWWKDYQIGVAIHDTDDYDVGVIYTAENEKQFFDVLHELINWINDLEHGLCIYDKFVDDMDGFFPDLGCEKEAW